MVRNLFKFSQLVGRIQFLEVEDRELWFPASCWLEATIGFYKPLTVSFAREFSPNGCFLPCFVLKIYLYIFWL